MLNNTVGAISGNYAWRSSVTFCSGDVERCARAVVPLLHVHTWKGKSGGKIRGGHGVHILLSTSWLVQTRFWFPLKPENYPVLSSHRHVWIILKGTISDIHVICLCGIYSFLPRQCGDVTVVGSKHQFYRWCVLVDKQKKKNQHYHFCSNSDYS